MPIQHDDEVHLEAIGSRVNGDVVMIESGWSGYDMTRSENAAQIRLYFVDTRIMRIDKEITRVARKR